jgi:hypothetical protein
LRKIKIICAKFGEIEAELFEDKNPKTMNAIWKNLPFATQANTWGDEIYFSIPVKIDEENSQSVVEIGDLGYWPPGQAFCIFFGPTPISRGNEIKPASPVNIFGEVKADPNILKTVKNGDTIRIERL